MTETETVINALAETVSPETLADIKASIAAFNAGRKAAADAAALTADPAKAAAIAKALGVVVLTSKGCRSIYRHPRASDFWAGAWGSMCTPKVSLRHFRIGRPC